jgi:hypothetical protein
MYIQHDGSTLQLDKNLVANNKWVLAYYPQDGERFNALLKKYPQQELLLRSILTKHPRSIYDVLDAPNFHIFDLNTSVLPEQERITMTEAVYAYVNMVRDRWYMDRYAYEHHYPASFCAVFYTGLFVALSDVRFRSIKTTSTHDYHIIEFLASHGLEEYLSILTLTQKLFLYQNIDYLISHGGKVEVLAILTEALLKTNYLDLISYKIAIDRTLCSHYDFGLDVEELVCDDPGACLSTVPMVIKQPIYRDIMTDNGVFEKQDFEYFYNRLLSDKLIQERSDIFSKEDYTWYERSNVTLIETKFVEIQAAQHHTMKKQMFNRIAIPMLLYYWSQNKLLFDVDITKQVDVNLALYGVLIILNDSQELKQTLPAYPVYHQPTQVELLGTGGWYYQWFDFLDDAIITSPVELLTRILRLVDTLIMTSTLYNLGNGNLSRTVRGYNKQLLNHEEPTVVVPTKYQSSPETILGTDTLLYSAYKDKNLSVVEQFLMSVFPFDKLPLEEVAHTWDRTAITDKMKHLIKSLCSYNIAFVS